MQLPEESFISAIPAWIISVLVFAAMVVAIYWGARIANRGSGSTGEKKGEGSIVSAMLGLLAFLLAFTFGMSGSRFDERRQIIVREANAIGTAILRSDIYPAVQRDSFRLDFRQYLEARIDYYEHRRNFDLVAQSLQTSDVFAKKLWNRAAALSHDPSLNLASMQMIPALNNMIDVTTTRKIGEVSQVPVLIVAMLFVLCVASAFFMGYSSIGGRYERLTAMAFCFLISVVIYITLDLDRPRRGFIQMETSQSALIELRQMFQ